MTPTQKRNIGNGVRRAFIRKRQSDAMKASWVRRRANAQSASSNNSTPPVCEPSINLIAAICRRFDIDQFTLEHADALVRLCEAFHEARSNE